MAWWWFVPWSRISSSLHAQCLRNEKKICINMITWELQAWPPCLTRRSARLQQAVLLDSGLLSVQRWLVQFGYLLPWLAQIASARAIASQLGCPLTIVRPPYLAHQSLPQSVRLSSQRPPQTAPCFSWHRTSPSASGSSWVRGPNCGSTCWFVVCERLIQALSLRQTSFQRSGINSLPPFDSE